MPPYSSEATDNTHLFDSIGHQLLDGNSLKCLCGQIGCLETFTGGRQVELRYGCPVGTNYGQASGTSRISLIGLVNLAQLTGIHVVAISGAIVLNNQFLLPLLQEKVNIILKGSFKIETGRVG